MKTKCTEVIITLVVLLFGCTKEKSESLPTVSTGDVTDITYNSAIISGIITSLGNSPSSTDYGFCYSSANQTPTIDDTKKSLGATIALGNFSSLITELTAKTYYNFRAYAVNSKGVSYGNPVAFQTLSNTDTIIPGLKIGDNYQGGKIAYFFDPGDPGYISGEVHGLIVATSDQGFGLQWFNETNILIGNTSRAIGTGKSNTNSIISIQGNGDYAAMFCNNLNLGGYNDWYLPSMDELNILYLNRTEIKGGFMGSNWYYWSSTERDIENAWAQCLFDGIQRCDGGNKFVQYLIRPIRTF